MVKEVWPYITVLHPQLLGTCLLHARAMQSTTECLVTPPIHTYARISSSEVSEAPLLFHSTKSCFFISSNSCMGGVRGG